MRKPTKKDKKLYKLAKLETLLDEFGLKDNEMLTKIKKEKTKAKNE